MKNYFMRFNFFLLCCLPMVTGCAFVTEISKTIWGSSTRALENARTEAIVRAYQCPLEDCFDAVLNFAHQKNKKKAELEEAKKNEEGPEEEKDKEVAPPSFFDVFLQGKYKQHIVIMGIPGSVNTTEVGVFFDDIGDGITKVEISSLSSNAKQTAAQLIFNELDLIFLEGQP